jgi:sensor histidine kinase YesM
MKEGLKPKKKTGPTEEELEELRESNYNIQKLLFAEPSGVIKDIKRYREMARSYMSKTHFAESYYFTGYLYSILGSNEKAVFYFNRAKKITHDNNLLHRIYVSIGVSYRQSGEYTKAIQSYTSALNTGSNEHSDAVYNNMAVIYYHLKEHDLAILYFSKAFEIYNLRDDLTNSLGILNNIGKILTIQKRYNEAFEKIKKAKEYALKNNVVMQIVVSDFNLGNLYYELGDYDQSQKMLEVAYQLCKIQQNKNQLYPISLLMAMVFEKLENYEMAKIYYEESLVLAMELSHKEYLDTLKKIHLFYELHGDYTAAYSYLKLLKEKSKIKMGDNKVKDLLKARFYFENKEKELKLEKFQKVNTINQILRKKEIQFQSKNYKLQKAVKDLSEGQLLRSQMNPHFIYNTLNSISALIKSKENKKANKYLLLFSKLMRNIYDLSSKEQITLFDELCVVKHYLEMELLRFGNSFLFHISISPDINTKQILLPPMVLQPIAENAVKHGFFQLDKSIRGCLSIIITNDVYTSKKVRVIKVEFVDNGVGLQDSKSFLKTTNFESALWITKRRLKYFNKSLTLENCLTYEPVLPHGSKFVLYIQKKGRESIPSS